MKQVVDTKMKSGVPSDYLLVTGKNTATAPVRIAAFLYPAFKGVPGCVGNISNTHGCFVLAVTNSPALCRTPLVRRRTMESPTRTTSEIPEMWRNNADAAQDTLYEVATILSFITESAPFTYRNCAFTEAGIAGLHLVLNDAQVKVLDAGRALALVREGGA